MISSFIDVSRLSLVKTRAERAAIVDPPRKLPTLFSKLPFARFSNMTGGLQSCHLSTLSGRKMPSIADSKVGARAGRLRTQAAGSE